MPSPSKVVLVTGASSGLGCAIAACFQRNGCRVYGTSRIPHPEFAWPMLPLDVRSGSSARACVGEVLAREQRIDVLVNNAGYAFLGALEETSVDEARAQMETNFFGALEMMLAVLPAMRERGSGHIVNISSISGVIGMPFAAVYAASKHALEGASESLAHELHGTSIHVTLVEPDGVRTGIGARFEQPAREHAILGPKRKRLVRLLEGVTALEGTGLAADVAALEVFNAVELPNPPLRVVIGEKAKQVIAAKRTMSEAAFANLLAALDPEVSS